MYGELFETLGATPQTSVKTSRNTVFELARLTVDNCCVEVEAKSQVSVASGSTGYGSHTLSPSFFSLLWDQPVTGAPASRLLSSRFSRPTSILCLFETISSLHLSPTSLLAHVCSI